MTVLAEYTIAALLILGGVFGLVGSFGLLKLQDPMQRLHVPTKATTIGVGAALIASVLNLLRLGQGGSWHEFVITGFLLLTAPLSALFLAKTHLLRTIDRKILPKTGTSGTWATLADQPPPGRPSPQTAAKPQQGLRRRR